MVTRPVITVPIDLMRVTAVNWDIDWRGQAANAANDGSSQVVYNAFPRWVGSPKFMIPPVVLGQWRALRWQAQGRVGIYRVPMFDPELFNRNTVAGYASAGILFSSGVTFSSGVGFAFDPFVLASQAAVLGATSVVVTVDAADHMPVVGQIMSANYWPFSVVAVTALTGTDVQLDVQPPLREAIAVADVIKLTGVGLFEAISDETGRVEYGLSRIATPTLELREVLHR